MIDRATVERIKDTADIVDVVSDYVHLIRRGSNYMGLCPFHNERTPSFSVNKQRNFCYCFSCKKGGSPVNFIMEKEGLSYHEALLHLAKKYGIEVIEKELTDEERERQSEREAMFVANEWAMNMMSEAMLETEDGRDIGLQYFTGRGVTDSAIKAFHLGYAPDHGQWLTDKARKAGFRLEILKKLGLIGTSQSGRDYDRFRGRVIFPILNLAGKVIAFGGRDLKGGMAKYINSPESELYKKSNELYGIFQAKSSIVSEDKCFLVEGYMDVIGMWQSGMKNVVASSGTALTDGQITLIHRFTENITLIYDGDSAGIKASLRGIDMLLSHKLNVKVLLLPDGDDPDSFARKHTPEEFKEYVKSHETDIIRFKAKVLLDSVKNDPQNRILAINSVVNSIAHIPDQVSRDVYIQECSTILDMPEATIAKSVAVARRELVEKIKKERTLKSYAQVQANPDSQAVANLPSSNEVLSNEPSLNNNQTFPTRTSNEPNNVAERKGTALFHSSVYPLEKEVLKYCIRYSYLPFCSYECENPKSPETPIVVQMNVLEFIEDELQQSDMSFTTPEFQKVFNLLKSNNNSFKDWITERKKELDKKYHELRQSEYEQIANSEMSMSDIERAEKKFEEELKKNRQIEEHNLIKDYAIKELCSHEDDSIRKLAMELSFDKHHLSNIYAKAGVNQSEEEKLTVLLVRAIDDWKNELINQRINVLFERMRNIAGQGNMQEEKEIQTELSALMNLRSEMAKIIGERIIFNKKI
ncbi:MAG: DNA primase [Bacteroides sp.]|nr:DNA primase [Bacteroides sp.]